MGAVEILCLIYPNIHNLKRPVKDVIKVTLWCSSVANHLGNQESGFVMAFVAVLKKNRSNLGNGRSYAIYATFIY